MSRGEQGPGERGAVAARPARVLLVDDHELVRSALAGAIEGLEGFVVCAQAGRAEEAIALAVEARPDVLVMDIDMPGMICFDAVARIRARRPELRVIFLSAFFNDRYIEEALRVGAAGYVVKGGPLSVLFDALRAVAAGGDYFSAEVRARIAGPGRETGTRASTLTERQVEVLRYVARGLSKKEIARTMGLSVKTVEHHCGNVMDKLGIHDRVELARFAIREGLAEA
jgi:DNA-binding NarL/FixJ family response regulator